ncbi:MAG TPA: helix-turn-helix transcriptional regulator [Hyphomicrobiales bacterium]|nr:helix-turn-helix transcriptional regulator [Hyphomicrobiales bacterium]
MKARTVVSRNIRRLRVAKGLSQEALAVDAGIDRTYVSRLERGLENPTVAVLERLASALNAKIIDFFDESQAGRGKIPPLPSGRRPRR